MSKEDTKKQSNFWKYSTIVLILVVIIAGFFLLKGKNTQNTIPPDTQQPVDLAVFTDNTTLYPSLGPADADIVVVEFSDFQCPYCALASGLPEFANQYSDQYADLIGVAQKVQEMAGENKTRFVYVPMGFLGAESIYASQAALCANNQGKFWEMHDLIFAAHDGKENNGKYSKANLKIMAQSIQGLDKVKFNNCLDKNETLAYVQQIDSESSTIVEGTPSFFVNGQAVSPSWNKISALI